MSFNLQVGKLKVCQSFASGLTSTSSCIFFSIYRCIYCKVKPSPEVKEKLDDLIENTDYYCGSPLIPDDHELATVRECKRRKIRRHSNLSDWN